MLKSCSVAFAGLMLSALAFPAAAAPEGYETLSVTNTTEQVAFCTLLFDSRARTELAIRPGKTWSEAFNPRRDLRLVCQRSKDLYFGPLAAGKSYRIVQAGSKITIADGAAE
jgi:hypothetical protein